MAGVEAEVRALVFAERAARDRLITVAPRGTRARIAAERATAAAERAEVRRLRRQLLQPTPPPKPPAPLTVAEQKEALTQALAARESGDTRAPQALLSEAESNVRAARPPRPSRER